MKKLCSIVLAAVLLLALTVPAIAKNTLVNDGTSYNSTNFFPTEGYKLYDYLGNPNVKLMIMSDGKPEERTNPSLADLPASGNGILSTAVTQAFQYFTGNWFDYNQNSLALLNYQNADAKGGYVEIKFHGTAINLGQILFRNGSFGAKVVIDGVEYEANPNPPATDFASRFSEPRWFQKSGLADTWHTVQIYSTGTDRLVLDFYEVIETAPLSAPILSAIDADDGSGCVKIPGGSGYHAMFFWTQFKDLNPHTISFYAKGTRGETLMFGYEGSYGVTGSYTFKATNQWEKVTVTATSTALPAAGDHTTNGFPFRVYVDSNTTNPIYVDYVQFDDSAITKFTGTDLNTTGAPFGAWSPSDSSEYCSTENYVDGKIQHLYLNAVVADDDATYGFILAENEYATDEKLRFVKDGGNPLFIKECKKYDVILEGAAYGESEITALNLGGEIGDKIICLYWKNMPVYGTFAYRTYKVLSNGAVIYGEIQTVSLEDGISLKPLAMPG